MIASAIGRLARDVGRRFDAPQRPAQSPQRQYLLFLVVAQDVAHPNGAPCPSRRRQRLGALRAMAGFQVSINGRFLVSTEGRPPGRDDAGSGGSRSTPLDGTR